MIKHVFLLFVLSMASAYPKYHATEEKLNKEKRIRGGTNVDISQAKYYVLATCGDIMCGGTLIRSNKVLTAGHCVESCSTRYFRIAVGLNSIAQYGQAKKYGASAINIHPKYDKNNPFSYDVAVVTLSQNVELSQNVGTIPYATTVPFIGSSLTIVGYGMTNPNGDVPLRLQRAQEKIIRLQNTQILTDARGPSVLSGDSGGPAVYENKLVGVTSGLISSRGQIILNTFIAVGHPEILSFVRQYAP